MKSKVLLEGYIHLRQQGKKMLTSLTIAYLLTSANDKSILILGISVCSKKDQFCKRTGRDIAHGRMLKRLYGKETFDIKDTEAFKSEKGRQELHKFIFKYYTANVPMYKIKKHIYMLNKQLY